MSIVVEEFCGPPEVWNKIHPGSHDFTLKGFNDGASLSCVAMVDVSYGLTASSVELSRSFHAKVAAQGATASRTGTHPGSWAAIVKVDIHPDAVTGPSSEPMRHLKFEGYCQALPNGEQSNTMIIQTHWV